MKYRKNIIVVGGFGKIGLTFVKSLLENGASVIVADSDKKKAATIIKKYNDKPISFIECDLSNDRSIDRLILQSKKYFNNIDAVIYCAYPKSKGWGRKFELIKRNHLNEDLNKQLGSSIIFSQKIMFFFKNQGHGNLIHLSSIQGSCSPKFNHYEGTNMTSPIEYSAMKAGIISLTKYLAKLYKKNNIRVNCISPGGITDNQPAKFKRNYKKDCGSKGLLDADDLVGAMLYLISDDSKYLNGQNINIDDGWSL